jgi:diguanylate cyclase (GGDEF)-like protein
VASVYRNTASSVWFSILVTWVIAYMLWGIAPEAGLLTWAGLATVLHLGRFVHIVRRLRSNDFLVDPEKESRAMSISLLSAGLMLAIGYLLFAAKAPLLEQYAITLFAVGITSGAATVLTGCRQAFLGYSMPPLIVIAGVMLWAGVIDGDGHRGFLGLMMSLFCAAIAVFQSRLDRTYLTSLRLRHDREGLVREKDALLAELHALNRELSADRDEFLVASLTDGLTGLANRRHFDRTLARDWERSRRDGTPLAFIMLDLDRFKDFNDRYGHMTGDDCLRAVAAAISETVSRGGDFAARYGGEEFVVLLPDTDARGASLIAERIRDAVAERGIPHAAPGGPGVVTLSAGVAAVTPNMGFTCSQSLVDLADEALYEAKHRGRNRVVVRDLDKPDLVAASLLPNGR